MRFIVFAVLICILYGSIQSTSNAVEPRWRLKREETRTADGFGTAEPDVCNVTLTSNSDRRRRSAEYSLNDSTTTESPPEDSLDISHLSPEFLKCTHIYVEPQCYEQLHNGSVYVPMYSMMFNTSDYLINQDLLFICPDFFGVIVETEKFPTYIPIVSFVCACISTVCIILHVVMFIIVENLRNLPGYCLLSLCVTLVAAYLCTFVQYAVSDHLGCTVIGMFLLYFFLASFFWMNAMAFDVWKSIRMATSKLRLTTNRPIMAQFARYSLYSWGMPLIIVLLSIVIHYSAPVASKYRLTFNISNCWFKYKQAVTLYFAGPIFSLIGMNVLFFGSSFYMISNAAMRSGTKGSSDLWSRLFLSLRLASVMGFMWIFGIIAALTRQHWLWYLYSGCSALQGVFIFCSFTVSERTRKVCRKALNKRKCSVMPTQTTSSQQMTSI